MKLLVAKENELRKQEMEMGREMKRRKNIEAIGEMTGKIKKGRDVEKGKSRGKEGKERGEVKSSRKKMCKERLSECSVFHKALYSKKPRGEKRMKAERTRVLGKVLRLDAGQGETFSPCRGGRPLSRHRPGRA